MSTSALRISKTVYSLLAEFDADLKLLCCREYSKQLNESRILILQAREDALQGIVQEAHAKLSKITGNKKQYTSLLTDLILQVTFLAQYWTEHTLTASNTG